MLLPNCPCCGSVARCDANPCCEGEGLPCALTIEYTGDGTWVNNGGLAAGDLADLEVFALQTWVAQQIGSAVYSINGGSPISATRTDAANPWVGFFQLENAAYGGSTRNQNLANVDGVPGCYAVAATQVNTLLSIKNNVQAGESFGAATLGVVLSSGAILDSASLGFTPDNSNWLMPFSYGAWCGLSSFSYEFRQPRSTVVPGHSGTFTAGWRFGVDLGGGVQTLATLRGGKVRFSW